MSFDPKELAKRTIPRQLLVRELRPSPTPAILLTFDDGPHPDVTPGVLARLEAHGVKAIFFLIGKRAQAEPALVQRIYEAGHRIGNHTHEHRDPNPSFVMYYRDVRRCQSVLMAHTGVRPELFRPPRGNLSPTTLVVPRLLGMRTVTWSLNVRDWMCCNTNQALGAAANLERRAAPKQIVVLHDDNPRVLEVLDYVLPRLKARGFDLQNAVDLL